MKLHQAHIQRLAEFIAQRQHTDGSFTSHSIPTDLSSSVTYTYTTTFITSLILGCLPAGDSYSAICKKASDFLLQEHSKAWSYNYWAKHTPEYANLPYPDDLDDTMCALIALTLHVPHTMSGNVLGSITKLLISTEQKPGGPYKTWIQSSPSDHWDDVDIAVNSNVAYFLSLHDVHLPNIEHFIRQKITQSNLYSPYYPTKFPIWYFISRWYKKDTSRLQKMIFEDLNEGVQKTVLDTALATIALSNFNAPPSKLAKSIEYLRNVQLDDTFGYDPFCYDPTRDGKRFVATSSALTASFCLEALRTHAHTATNTIFTPAKPLLSERIHTTITLSVQKTLKKYPYGQVLLNKLIAQDPQHQITLLPYVTLQTMRQPHEADIPSLVHLGTASLYGWIAYTIFDDFLDEEAAPQNLPLALLCFRFMIRNFDTITNKEFQKQTQILLERMNDANTWEVTHARLHIPDHINHSKQTLPEYKNLRVLAGKSIGHALSAIGIAYTESNANPEVITALSQFFEHYLIARQLNDDIHDWKSDIKNGHISPVVARLLRHSSFEKNDIDTIIEICEEQFWHSDILIWCDTIQRHVDAAIKALHTCPKISDPEHLLRLLAPLQHSVTQVRDDRKKTMQFIKSVTV